MISRKFNPWRAMMALFFCVVIGAALPVFAEFPDYPAYHGQPVTLTEWAWTSNENFSNDAFHKAYPSITIKWDNFGVHYDKLNTAIAAGKGLPDIIMCEYAFAPQFMDAGAFQPINKWVSMSLYKKLFPDVSLKWVSMDGKLYGTPQDSGAITMVYRKDIFDKYGLKVPTTWEEFAVQAQKLHQQNPDIAFTTIPINSGWWPLGMVQQAGGRLFDEANKKWYINYSNPIANKVFSYWDDLLQKKAVKFDMWWSADWYKELADGGSATVLCGAWFPEWLQLNNATNKGLWRVAEVPQWDPAHPLNGAMGGSGFYVSRDCKNPEAAAKFVLWLNSHKESLVNLHDRSQLPVLVSKVFSQDVAPSYAETEYPFFGGQKITPVIMKGDSLLKTSFTTLPMMGYIQSSMRGEFQKVADGKQSLKEAVKNWEANVIDFMKKQGYNNLVVGKLP